MRRRRLAYRTVVVSLLGACCCCGLDGASAAVGDRRDAPSRADVPRAERPALDAPLARTPNVAARPGWLGVIVANRAVEVRSPTSAVVTALDIAVGQPVAAGDVLVQLDPTSADEAGRLQGALASAAKARSRQAEVERRGAVKELARVRSLHASGYAPSAQLDVAKQSAAVADATSERARAEERSKEIEVQRSQRQRQERHVEAPFAGVVARRHVASGDAVHDGAPLVRLLEMRAPRVVFAIDRDASVSLPRVGDKITVITEDGMTAWEATVDAARPDADLRTGVLTFEAALDCDDPTACAHATPVVVLATNR